MWRFLSFCLISSFILTATSIQADDKLDPSAQAKLVSPYIDEQTFLIARVDFTRIKIDWAVDTLCRLLPDDKDEILQAKATVQQTIDSFIQAGGKDVYLRYRANRQDCVFFVIPIGDKFDQQAIEKNDIFKVLALKRAGNVMIGSVGTQQALTRLEKTTSDPRPELAAAFETAGDSPIQVLLLPPKYFRRVIEETMPRLPKEIGGGSTNVITKGLSWGALGISFSPQVTARLVIQSPDASSAAALNVFFEDVLKNVAELPNFKTLLPSFAGTVPYLTPKPEGDKLVLNIDESKAEVCDLLGKIQTAMFSEARDSAQRMQSINNMKQIGLAMHNYHDANKHFPACGNLFKR